MSMNKNWLDIKAALEVRRTELNEEIASYPGPITGCDAQFNYLLERRAGLNAELARLAGMGEGAGANTLKKFVEACPYLDGPGGEKQQ